MMEYYYNFDDEPNLDNEFSDMEIIFQDRSIDYLSIYNLYIRRKKP